MCIRDRVKACDEAGVRLFVIKQNRRNATLQLLKRAVEKKRFGRIYMVNINVFWTRPQEYYDSAKWRGTWEFDGGAFMNQASHYAVSYTHLWNRLDLEHEYCCRNNYRTRKNRDDNPPQIHYAGIAPDATIKPHQPVGGSEYGKKQR